MSSLQKSDLNSDGEIIIPTGKIQLYKIYRKITTRTITVRTAIIIMRMTTTTTTMIMMMMRMRMMIIKCICQPKILF